MKVVLGREQGRDVFLTPDVRATHLHVVGGTGSGKSRFLEHLVREDIRSGHGVCFIDPHGTTYHALIKWMAREQYDRARTVHLINLQDPTHSVGFNPLCSSSASVHVRINTMIRAMQKVWPGDFTATPRLARTLQLVLYVLAEHRLSLLEADFLTLVQHDDVRRRLTANLPDTSIQSAWDEINSVLSQARNHRIYLELFEAIKNRLHPLVTSPALKPIIGQTSNVIDFRSVMDRNEIVLVNLGSGGDGSESEDEDARVLGAMLFSELFISAKRRDEQTAELRPFYCYVDECADYLTDDIARALDQTRKFGLHLTLAHQRLSQLGKPEDNLYDGVMESARSKVVFQLDTDHSAEFFSRHLFRKEFDLERVKHILDKPVVVDYVPEWLESNATSQSQTEGRSENWAKAETESAHWGEASSTTDQWSEGANTVATEGTGQFMPIEGDPSGITVNVGSALSTASSAGGASTEVSSFGGGRSFTKATGEGVSLASSQSTTSGRHQTLRPELQVLPTATFSLEDQIHLGLVAIRSLPKRQAFAYLTETGRPFRFQTTEVPDVSVMPIVEKLFLERVKERSACTALKSEVRASISRRYEKLNSGGVMVTEEPDGEDLFSVPISSD